MAFNLTNANELLLKLSEANESLIEQYFEFQKTPGIKNVQHGFDMRKCEGGNLIDYFIEAEISDDLSYCWWIEIRINCGNWSISGTLSKTQHGEQHLLLQVCNYEGQELSEFLSNLATTVKAIVDSAQTFDFQS